MNSTDQINGTGGQIIPYFVRDPQRQAIRFGILIKNRLVEKTSIATNLTFAPLEPNIGGPDLMTLKYEEAQAFMDELWNIGIRPSSGEGSAGQLAATEKHLEDMRRLHTEANAAIIQAFKTATQPTSVVK